MSAEDRRRRPEDASSPSTRYAETPDREGSCQAAASGQGGGIEGDVSTAEAHYRALLEAIVPPGHLTAGMEDTPRRYVAMLREMTAGYRQDPAAILSTTFDVEGGEARYDEMIVLSGIEFVSLCEHHVMSFRGTAAVGYLPDLRVVGISKLARLVDCFARRLQIQERLTAQVAWALMTELRPHGVGVVVRAHHECMSCRGVRKNGSEMVTSSMLGAMRDDPSARAEFFSLATRG